MLNISKFDIQKKKQILIFKNDIYCNDEFVLVQVKEKVEFGMLPSIFCIITFVLLLTNTFIPEKIMCSN